MRQVTLIALPVLLLLLLAVAPADAQRDGRVSVGADVGVLWPRFDRSDVEKFHTEAGLLYGGHIAYGFTEHVGMQLGLTRSMQAVDVGGHELNNMVIQELYALINWNFPLGVFQPFVGLGGGYYLITLDPPLPDENNAGMILSAGTDALVTDNISVGLSVRYSYIFAHEFDFARGIAGLATVAFAF